ncbi:MAG TPA: TIGR04219 family outer membrane beta-barrel protein [Gammaproteobacteria bacterium]|nr:TIGR04219 family outer membrane beta-barrel protein [Gammaproteobacteria bacterium]
MDRTRTLALVFSLLPALAGADTLGVRIGTSYWNYDISGSVRYRSSNSSDDIDVNRDLGYDDDQLVYLYAVLEHPLPFLPNIRVSRTRTDVDANGRLSRTVVYGDVTFVANEDVSSKVRLDQTDITLYYRLLDKVVSLDLGINAKYLDSKGRISGSLSGSESADVSGWAPMLYAGTGVDLPLTGLSLGADGSAVKYRGSTLYDYSVHASYTTPWHLGIDAGYRAVKLDLDDFNNSYADIELDGPYVGAYLHF